MYCHIVHLLFFMMPPAPRSTLFPYTTLFRSQRLGAAAIEGRCRPWPTSEPACERCCSTSCGSVPWGSAGSRAATRSEEHTSELQSHLNLVWRLLLEKKKRKYRRCHTPQRTTT